MRKEETGRRKERDGERQWVRDQHTEISLQEQTAHSRKQAFLSVPQHQVNASRHQGLTLTLGLTTTDTCLMEHAAVMPVVVSP